jgi:hypothetical protein
MISWLPWRVPRSPGQCEPRYKIDRCGFQEYLHQGQDAFVCDAATHPAHQGGVVDFIEGSPNALRASMISSGGLRVDATGAPAR